MATTTTAIWTINPNNEVEQITLGEYLSDNMINVTHRTGIQNKYSLEEIGFSENGYDEAAERAGIEVYDEDGNFNVNLPVEIYEVKEWSQFSGHDRILFSTTDRELAGAEYVKYGMNALNDDDSCNYFFTEAEANAVLADREAINE